MKEIINTDKAPAPIGPYNQAIKKGNSLFISGQIALDAASGSMINDTIQNETAKVLENLNAILVEANFSKEDIVKCSIFIKDMNQFQEINTVYASYFEGTIAPARETVEVVRLPKDVNVEISAIAMK